MNNYEDIILMIESLGEHINEKEFYKYLNNKFNVSCNMIKEKIENSIKDGFVARYKGILVRSPVLDLFNKIKKRKRS